MEIFRDSLLLFQASSFTLFGDIWGFLEGRRTDVGVYHVFSVYFLYKL